MSHSSASFQLLPLAAAVSLALPLVGAWAQGTVLGTVTVTASATETAVKDAPASLSILTAEDIQRVPAADLNEVLRRVPGLTQATTPDGGTSIQIRGLPQQYTLILVDGVRVGSSSETFDRYTRNELNWIPPESIERIEVVRGPMSSLYGSDAMGGVINIITKKTGARWGGQVTAGAEVNPKSIRGNDYTGGFTIGGPLAEGLKLRINGQQTYRQADSGLADGTTAFRWGGGREGARLQSLGGRLDWDLNASHKLSLDLQRSEWQTLSGPTPSTSNPGGFAAASTTRGPAKMERESFALAHAGKYSFGTSRLSVSQSRYANRTTAPVTQNGRFVYVPGTTTAQTYTTEAVSKDLVVDGSVSMPLKFGFDQLLTVGAQWQRSELDNPNSVGSVANASGVVGLTYKEARSQALFFENQIFLRDNLSLTLGLRADDHEDYGSHLSPRAYVVYHPTSAWTVRGGYSEGFRAPTLRQSNPNFVSQSQGAGCTLVGYQGGGCATRGNADLKPETSENVELGVAWEHNDWQAGLTFFNTDFTNKIDARGIGYLNGGSTFWAQYVNVDSAVTRGLEANLRVPVSRTITWSNSLTHMLKAENKTTGAPLSAVSKWSGSSVVDWQVNPALGVTFGAELIGKQMGLAWRIANNATGFGEQRIQNSYVLYEIGANYRVNQNLRLNVGVKNLFDRNTNGSRDSGNNFYMPGRRFFATLTAGF
ncbi:TonB-dependent receptor [Acidovorax sp. NCPPB 2350]|nr:TonB-dependent receptor [Acidovorax sp. NCPPB 2350]